ncbi:TOBE domain-containing protein [Methylosarcina fibrata]|uniref:TOBE domain-containing protein n=1 Tax=Methylosarcina fibrata TaxID=105972 RepID=UPI0003678AA4|nr:TOBE domain-containing protein [Methylosarcina fibrata]
MKVSARNQFKGTVSAVRPGSFYTEVLVHLKGGDNLVATVTKESAQSLAIAPGKEVIAMIKAPHVILVTDFGGYRISARNQLEGKVVEVKPGAINSEVDIELKGGEKVAATITNESVEALGLYQGQTATAVFKAGSVILAVAE